LEERIEAKRELQTLRFQDQSYNLNDTLLERKESQDKILQKHVKLYKSVNRQKERLDELQIKQRMAEIQKKRELFHDYWN
jgi:hypothetical protein